jgi:hypothetical protein
MVIHLITHITKMSNPTVTVETDEEGGVKVVIEWSWP